MRLKVVKWGIMPDTYGAIAESIKFEEPELSRIASHLADINSINFQVLIKEIKNMPKERQKSLVKKVPALKSFRIGKKSFYDRLCSLVRGAIGDVNHTFHVDALGIYKNAVVSYLGTELKPFNQILLNEEFKAENYSSEDYLNDLLRTVAEINPRLIPAVGEFYRLWGFPRSISLDKWISEKLKAERSSSLLEDNKLFLDVKEEVENLKVVFSGLQSKIEGNFLTKEEFEKKVKELSNQVQDLLMQVELNKNEIKENEVMDKLRANQRELSKSAKVFSKHIKALMKGQHLDRKNEERLSKLEKSMKGIDRNHKSLLEKFSWVETSLNGLLKFKARMRTESSFKVLSKKKHISEEEFILKWYSEIEKSPTKKISLDQAVVYHSIFKSSTVSIIEDGSIFKSWIAALGWLPGNEILAANPVWTREEDWLPDIQNLNGGTLLNFFPTLVILKYDCGIPEAAFLPSLTRFNEKRDDIRVALIPTNSHDKEVIPEFLEVAPFISADDIRSPLNNIKGSSVEYKAVNKHFAEIVPGENFNEWCDTNSQNAESSSVKTVLTIAQGVGIRLPFDLIGIFEILLSNLEKYFSDDDALILASRYTLLPWIKSELGEGMLSTFLENLSASIGREVTK